MNTTEQEVSCPVCENRIRENDKFCSKCGVGLNPKAPDAAWIAAMRERIKRAKETDLYLTVFSVVGVLAAIFIPFATRFILDIKMELLSWLLTGAGIFFFIGGIVGTWYNDKIVKRLTELMEKGPEEK